MSTRDGGAVPPGVPVGFLCGNTAYAVGWSGVWVLGWEWFAGAGAAVEWLVRAGRLMAVQVSPTAEYQVRAWCRNGGAAAAREGLGAGRGVVLAVLDGRVRYELWVRPVAAPPGGGDVFVRPPRVRLAGP